MVFDKPLLRGYYHKPGGDQLQLWLKPYSTSASASWGVRGQKSKMVALLQQAIYQINIRREKPISTCRGPANRRLLNRIRTRKVSNGRCVTSPEKLKHTPMSVSYSKACSGVLSTRRKNHSPKTSGGIGLDLEYCGRPISSPKRLAKRLKVSLSEPDLAPASRAAFVEPGKTHSADFLLREFSAQEAMIKANGWSISGHLGRPKVRTGITVAGDQKTGSYRCQEVNMQFAKRRLLPCLRHRSQYRVRLRFDQSFIVSIHRNLPWQTGSQLLLSTF